MKIAFTSTGTSWDSTIDPRFGRTDFLLIFNDADETLEAIDNRSIKNVEHGAGPKTAQLIAEHAPQILITGNGLGGNAASVLKLMNLKIYVGAGGMTVRDAYLAYQNNQLKEGV